MTMLAIDKIRIDGGTQPRAEISESTVREYAEDLANGANFDPVVVYYDGTDHWLADGFHRVAAHRLANMGEVFADVRQGTRRDAVLFSVGANSAHGLRRTNTDKRRAVETLLRDPEWSRWSDSEIGRRCCVDHKVATRLRASLGLSPSEPRTFTTRHGTEAVMRTERIGRKARQKQDAPLATDDCEEVEDYGPAVEAIMGMFVRAYLAYFAMRFFPIGDERRDLVSRKEKFGFAWDAAFFGHIEELAEILCDEDALAAAYADIGLRLELEGADVADAGSPKSCGFLHHQIEAERARIDAKEAAR